MPGALVCGPCNPEVRRWGMFKKCVCLLKCEAEECLAGMEITE